MAISFEQHQLVQVIKRSLGSLRLAILDLQAAPSKLTVDRVTTEADTLSGAISGLARHVNFDQLLPANRTESPRRDGPDYLALGEWLIAAIEHEHCPRCDLPRRQPEPPVEDGAELSKQYRSRLALQQEKTK